MHKTIHKKTEEKNKSVGKNTKRRRLRRSLYLSAFTAGIILCGCTRREQLLLEEPGQDLWQELSAEQSVQTEEGKSGQAGTELSGQTEEGKSEQAEEEISGQAGTGQSGQAEGTVREEETQTIFVHVCGAVNDPGVYELPLGIRVHEAVEAAGGFAEDADEDYVNQAQPLTDGTKLVIPTHEQVQAAGSGGYGYLEPAGGSAGISDGSGGASGSFGGASGGSGSASDGRVNINTASESELCSIPGIGAVRAAAIVAYRQEKGGFASIEEIKNVDGIKEGTFEKIKDSIKIK